MHDVRRRTSANFSRAVIPSDLGKIRRFGMSFEGRMTLSALNHTMHEHCVAHATGLLPWTLFRSQRFKVQLLRPCRPTPKARDRLLSCFRTLKLPMDGLHVKFHTAARNLKFCKPCCMPTCKFCFPPGVVMSSERVIRC